MNTSVSDFAKLGKFTSDAINWDIVTIGSGHNGLLAAAYLAAAGKKVLVLERASYPGGGVASLPMAEEGYISERHSAVHGMILANPLITRDELGLQSKYGLKYIPLDPAYAIIMTDRALPLYQDRRRSMEAIAEFSPDDAESYAQFIDIAARVTDQLMPGMFEPPDTVAAPVKDPQVFAEIDFASGVCTRDVVEKWFKNEILKVAMLRFVTEIQLAHPMTKGTGLMGYLAFGLLDRYGLCIPQGGGSAFTSSVIRCLEDHGGEIRLNTEVTKVVTEGGRAVAVRTRAGEIRAREAIIGMIHPHLLDQFVDGLDPSIVTAAKATRTSEFTVFVIHAALEQPLRYKAGDIASRAAMNTVCPGSMADLLRSYDDMAAGKVPENIMIGMSCTSGNDPTRCPPGKALLHCVVMVKHELADLSLGGWDKFKDELAHRVFAYASQYLIDFTPDCIRSYHVVTPLDHSSDSPSFQHGDICGLSMGGDQMGANRPTPALAQYRIPGVKGLYLAGPFMHPGGGVWGGGRPVAKRILEDLGISFDQSFRTGPASRI